MARKKKGGNMKTLLGVTSGIVITGVVLYLFALPLVLEGERQILPQDVTPELEIPFEQPPPPVLPPELTIDDIDDLINNPNICVTNPSSAVCNVESICEIDQGELQRIAECELLTQDEQVVESDPTVTADECSQIHRASAEQCDEQIDALIQQILEDSEPVEQPEQEPETSIDDPFTQICDQTPDLIICGDSRSLELLTTVLKTDSAGVQTTVETTTGIPQLSFFVEDTSNIDYRNGQLQFEIQIKGDPNLSYLGTGKVDLLIGNQSVFTVPVDVKVDGIADEEGKVDLLFISPTGIPSSLILFDFADNFNTFPDESITPVRLHVVDLNISGERDQDFALIDSDVFTMDIAREEIKLLITDEEGITTRVYPSDSRIIITPKTSVSEPAITGVTRQTSYDSIFKGNGRGCSLFTVVSDRSFTPSTETTATVPAPTITSTILDDEGNVVTSGSGRLDYTTLTRNENYIAKVNQLTSSPLDYGKSQETKSYVCTQEGTPDTKSYSTTSGSTANCGYYTITRGITLSGTFTITPNSLTCNFPQETP